ncbi:MAG: helix-turn-helix domain-containing protein, partial [Actinomycetota bacterium]|nr:helix-turn-helix domain-containing protein [Actinomycetota bacterium]
MPAIDRPRSSGRAYARLSLPEREEIACLRGAGVGINEISRRLGRAPSTISRELRRHRTVRRPGYRA